MYLDRKLERSRARFGRLPAAEPPAGAGASDPCDVAAPAGCSSGALDKLAARGAAASSVLLRVPPPPNPPNFLV